MLNKSFLYLSLTGLLLLLLAGPALAQENLLPASPVMKDVTRVVCLGDSITDGQTWSLLVAQALREGKRPVPIFIPAGIGGDTSTGMLKRLERDVLRYKPQMVMMNVGINDTAFQTKTKDFEANLKAITERLKAEKVRLMLFTLTTTRGRKIDESDVKSLDYEFLTFNAANIILRRTAEQNGCLLAEVSKSMAAAPRGLSLWELDGCHLNFDGFCYMSRAILDTMGYPEAQLPKTLADFKPPVMPGIIPEWRIRPAKDGEKLLDDKAVAELKIDESWHPYTLPETTSVLDTKGWWFDQERQRGFALQLKTKLGPAPRYYGYAEIESATARTAYLNTGASVSAAWLNGARVPIPSYAVGWHAGGHRIPIELKEGKNTLLISTGDMFFVSVTETEVW